MNDIKNPVLYKIWEDRYRKNNESLDDNYRRVAKYVAHNSNEEKDFYEVISEGLFLPAGRTMSNSGIGDNLTLNNCFKAGAKVQTDAGFKNIEDIKIGDMVLGADNKYHKVVNTIERDYCGDIFHLKSKYFYDDIYCTPNHQFLTQNGWTRADRLMIGERVHSQDKLKTPSVVFNKEYEDVDITTNFPLDEKTRICDNQDGTVTIERLCNKNPHNDNVNWMKVNNHVNRTIKFTPEFRYFIGRWIGDGSITRYKGKHNHTIIQIVFNASKERDIAIKCKEIGDNTFGFNCEWRETNQNIIVLRWNNEILATWFYQEFGEKCDGKHLDKKYIGDIEIAKGLFDSDGCIDTHGGGKLVLKNKSLIEWFRDTMFLNGYNTFRVQESNKHEDTYAVTYSTYVGKKGFNQQLTKTYYDKRLGYENIKTIWTDYVFIDSIDIEENQNCKVYNLSVEDEHSYTVNGVVVHNCFVAPQIPDDLKSIFDTVKLGAVTHKAGGGIGYDFSLLRPEGTTTSNDAIASGPVSFMEVFNTQTSTILQGNRRGANMGVMNIYHPDIEKFITAKTEQGKFTHFNLSVMVDDNFMHAVENNENVFLHYPVYDENGKILNDESQWKIKTLINAKELWNKIMKLAYDNGEPGIFFYDNMNKDNNLYYTENIVCSNPCSEYLAGTVYGVQNPSEYGGACNLGSIILPNFIINPFTSDATIDAGRLIRTIRIAVRMLDNIIDVNKFPDKIYENYQKRFRTIGLGITGLADALAMLNLKYSSEEGRKYVDNLLDDISYYAYEASCMLAQEKGSFPGFNLKMLSSGYLSKQNKDWNHIRQMIGTDGIRNAKIMSIAPTGTMSLTFGNNCSSGIEPIFSLEYERKVKFGGQSKENTQVVKIRDFAYEKWLEFNDDPNCIVNKDIFETALNMSVDDHVNMLAVIAKHVDMSVSKTINIPTEYSFDDTKNVYMKCWKSGIKGCTIFRPNELRQGVLIDANQKNQESKVQTEESIPRGAIMNCSDDLVGKKRKLTTGCGSLHVLAFFDPYNGDLQEVYFNKGSTGGCANFMTGLSRTVSLLCRAGVDIATIKDQLDSSGVCPSYATRAATKHDTSKGSCCPMAIGNALVDMWKEMQDEINDTCDADSEVEYNKPRIINDPKRVSENNNARCPECGEPLEHEGGCDICKSCGYSHCG